LPCDKMYNTLYQKKSQYLFSNFFIFLKKLNFKIFSSLLYLILVIFS